MTPEDVVATSAAEQLQKLGRELEAMKDRMLQLLERAGQKAICAGCGIPIYFVLHRRTNRWTPYEANGANHFIACNQRDQFRKRS